MTRFPLAAAAGLAALGLLVAACGGAAPTGHQSPASSSPSPSAKVSSKATPTPTATKPLSAAAQAAAGFRNWAQAAVLLTGGGPGGLPVASMPAAEADILVIRKAFYFPGWETSLGKGNILVETPTACMSSGLHVIGAFPVPANAPVTTGKVALVVRGSGVCHTEAGGQVFMNVSASAPPATWVFLGATVPLPPVSALPNLPTEVWTPVYEGTCQSGFVLEQGALFPSGVVPGC